jgi:ERG2 and Sigma1 receptor like protein
MTIVFNPDDLHAIAKAAVGLDDRTAACEQIVTDLKHAYPRYIRYDIPWLLNNAGGAMGQMKLLHCSLTEYLILFGTPIGTEGHSGRYPTEVWDFVYDGQVWCYEEGELDRTEYRPGDVAYLGRGHVKGYAAPGGAYMLEYARGPIPTMMAFGVADSTFSTVDAATVAKTAWYYAKLVARNLRQGKI